MQDELDDLGPGAPVTELTVPAALAIATEMLRRGHLTEAEALYGRILEAEPGQPDCLHFLGVLKHRRGDNDAAVDLLRAAVDRAPDYADACNSLGNVLSQTGRLEEAEAAYRRAVALRPDFAEAYNNLGVVLKDLDKLEEAAAVLSKALEMTADNLQTLHNLGNVLRRQGKYAEAAEAYHKAIDSLPFQEDSYRNLARLYYATGQNGQAAEVYRKWLEHQPDNATAQHMLAAAAKEAVPERASEAFVKSTFERFAESFDKVLERLEYRAPGLVAGLIEAGSDRLAVLDAGCGTGLCGPLLRPHARHLTGVDLSPAMIEKAREREVYDELVAAELTDYLGDCDARFDLIAAADSLCYFGDLTPVLAAAAGALRPEGRLVFTLEAAEGEVPAEGFRLEVHGRYSHEEDYVRSTLGEAGLELGSLGREVLRLENHRPVVGLLVMACKPSASLPR